MWSVTLAVATASYLSLIGGLVLAVWLLTEDDVPTPHVCARCADTLKGAS